MSKRWVVVTGCSSGIGLHVATGLQKRGFWVIACCRTPEQKSRLSKDFKHTVHFDLADAKQVEVGAKEILALCEKRLYALFNNAAYGQPGAVEDLPRDVLEKQFATNVFGTHQLTQLLLPAMLMEPRAHIIQHSSVLGFVGMAYRGAYNASKYALEGLSDTLRQELTETGVQVSVIQPGPVLSQFRKNALKAFRENIAIEGSRHEHTYRETLKRLEADGPAVPFTVGPEAVLERVVHALESKRARVHYPVTKPTYALTVLKRLLPSRLFDAVVKAASKA